LAPRHLLPQIPSFEGLRPRAKELTILFDGGEPKAEGVAIIIAGSLSVTFYEGRGAEIFEARTRRGEFLSCPLSSCSRME